MTQPLPPKLSLCIATPTNNSLVSLTCLRALLGLQLQCVQRGIGFQLLTTGSASVLPAARNMLADQFLHQTEATHLLFLDADMGFEPLELMHMLEFADRDVVAAVYPSKSFNWAAIASAARKHPEAPPAELAEIAGNFDGMVSLPDGATFAVGREPVEVATIGTGIMLISRAILLRLAVSPNIPHHIFASKDRTIPAFFENGTDAENRYVGEDYIFCQRVRAAGGKIWGCPWLRTTHSGNVDFVGNLGAIVAAGQGS